MQCTEIDAKPATFLLVCGLLLTAFNVKAQSEVTVAYLQGKAPVAPDAVATLGPDLFGDKNNLFNGALSFEHTDLSLPGNDALPVALIRQHSAGRSQFVQGQLGDWDIDVPRIGGSFLSQEGWVTITGGVDRCTRFSAPPAVQSSGVSFGSRDYWQGTYIHVPGQGAQEVLAYASEQIARPEDGNTYRAVTHGNWHIRCLSSIQNGAGEGFVAVSPEGVTYRFDWMASRQQAGVKKEGGSVGRQDIYLFATQVTDRFKNWVRYQYSASNPYLLTSISGSDGRLITIQNSGGRAVAASDGTKTITYSYSGHFLRTVALPDGSRWTFELWPLVPVDGYNVGEGANCDQPGDFDAETYFGTITHPSGAEGRFGMRGGLLGRTQVQRVCVRHPSANGPTNLFVGAVWPQLLNVVMTVSKRITGPGLPEMNWSWDYGGGFGWIGCTQTRCSDGRRTVVVTGPDNTRTRYVFGSRWRVDEGQLLQVDEGWNGSGALKTTTNRYRQPAGQNQNYPEQFGYSLLFTTDWLSARHRPLDRREIAQDGASFVWEADPSKAGFDRFARAVLVMQRSSLGFSRGERTLYEDNLRRWVIGQVGSLTETSTGAVVESQTFDPATALPLSRSSFGRVVESLQYNPDGTLFRRLDAAGRPTTFYNYFRGVSQLVDSPDGTRETAVVNNNGRITSYTNAVNTTTWYAYDIMSRLARITYPTGDPATYHPTVISFAPSAVGAAGLPSGHWQQVITTGNARTENFYDGMWRLRLARTWDVSDLGNSARVVEYHYDSEGRKTYESYPQRRIDALGSAAPGTSWQYDALGRVTSEVKHSELGPLTTTTEFLNGFVKQVKNPRGFSTATAYQAWDTPSEDHVHSILAPEGVSLSFTRDAFGKPLSTTRSGNGTIYTRSYSYDGRQRLCRTVEPEAGVTLQDYDAAGNLAWRATGLSNSVGCGSQPPEARTIRFGYDAMNRLTNTTYGDGSQTISQSYTLDGLLERIDARNVSHTANPIIWMYTYNNRRTLVREQYAWWQGAVGWGDGWAFSYGINASGHVESLTDPWPWWGVMSFAPNALGQPTRVSGYAHSVGYHPDGQLARFTFANGRTFTNLTNIRGLPEVWQHGGVSRDRYSYDANGNITAIADELGGQRRSMPLYDGLDRLRQAHGPWGSAAYGYDAQDNVIHSRVGARDLTHHYDAQNRLTNLTGSQSIGVGYDLNGNVTQRGAQGFSFDIGNRLTSAWGKANYTYDGHGRRNLASFANGDYTHQAYTRDGKLRLAWRPTVGGTRHVYLGDQHLAEQTETGTTFTHADPLGSPVARTNSAGGLVSRTHYEPYGATVPGSANPASIGFTGHVNDVDTGLVYMQQRYYDPVIGRFLSVDPVKTDPVTGALFNRYSYANNNPYKFTDPDGRLAFLVPVIAKGIAVYSAYSAGKTVIDIAKAVAKGGDGARGEVMGAAAGTIAGKLPETAQKLGGAPGAAAKVAVALKSLVAGEAAGAVIKSEANNMSQGPAAGASKTPSVTPVVENKPVDR